MQISLNHKFIKQAHDLSGLLEGCNKISTFCNRLEKQSMLFPDRYDPNVYKGDGLELFTEALIKLSPVDNRIGIRHYNVIEGQDIGVDGTGIGTNNKPATVQVKYRNNSQLQLIANDLETFLSASLLHEGVDPKDVNNMLVVTTAKGLHHFTDNEMYKNQVRCLGYEQLRELVDNNFAFWDEFRTLLKLN